MPISKGVIRLSWKPFSKDDPSDYGEVKRARDARVALMVTAPTKQQQQQVAADGDALDTNVGA